MSGGEGTRTLEPLDCQSSALPTELRPQWPRHAISRQTDLSAAGDPGDRTSSPGSPTRPPPRTCPLIREKGRLRSGVAYPGVMARAYDVGAVERKWQRHWDDEGTYRIENDDPRPKFYALCMYPYPSGPAHQGHVRNYTFGDLTVRYQTMQGKGVLSPIGFDSFGLPPRTPP